VLTNGRVRVRETHPHLRRPVQRRERIHLLRPLDEIQRFRISTESMSAQISDVEQPRRVDAVPRRFDLSRIEVTCYREGRGMLIRPPQRLTPPMELFDLTIPALNQVPGRLCSGSPVIRVLRLRRTLPLRRKRITNRTTVVYRPGRHYRPGRLYAYQDKSNYTHKKTAHTHGL
jgi:hypothetical protein